jgi:diguanylate cyclase (GGDEF)-like protein
MLLGSATLDELFQRITDELKRLVPYDAVTIYQVDEVAQLLVPLLSVDTWADEIMGSPSALGEGITGWVVQHGVPENLPQAHDDPRITVVPGTPEDEHEALASVPLTVRDGTIGALNVYRLGDDVAFTDDEFELICRFADLVALALDNTQNRERLVKEAQTDWLTGLHNHRFFHERLRRELDRSRRYARPVSLIVFDLDDFKLLNDVHGHNEGDLVLRRVAAAAREDLRTSDLACRVGGEEFAILLPETGKRAARAAAERLCARVRALPGERLVTVSCGVATFPGDANDATELLTGADAALYTAKARGKDRSAAFTAAVRARRVGGAAAELESLTQLRALSTLAGRLNRLNDVHQIGDTIVTELRGMVDYHNARVYVVEEDGETLEPIAFRGELSEYEGETLDALRSRVGEGITGTAALTGRTLNVTDANDCEFAVDVPGTADIEESILAVPLRYGPRTVGVIVLSKLGLDQFSALAVRVLELLGAQAAVALENARLLDAQRRAADVAEGLLSIATMASHDPSSSRLAQHVVTIARRLTGAAGAAVVQTGGLRHRVLASDGEECVRSVAVAASRVVDPRAEGAQVLQVADLPVSSTSIPQHLGTAVVAPVHGGTLVLLCEQLPPPILATTTALAGQATLALRNAELLAQLRRAG